MRNEKICDNKELMNEVVDNFLAVKPKKRVWNNFRIEGNELAYHSTETLIFRYNKDDLSSFNIFVDSIMSGTFKLLDKTYSTRSELEEYLKTTYRTVQYKTDSKDVIAVKLVDGTVLGNSSILPMIGRTFNYGNENSNRVVTVIQTILEQKVVMVPFSVFNQAKLDLFKYKSIEKSSAEKVIVSRTKNEYDHSKKAYVDIKFDETRHFTGASLFEVDGKQFLFDIDRNEIKHKIFNAFLVELPKKVKSISEAYESLKPADVIKAEKSGKKVLRQGEWFFIPTAAPKLPKLTIEQKCFAHTSRWDFERNFPELKKTEILKLVKKSVALREKMPRALELRAGQNRPNTAQMGVKVGNDSLVTGKISHSGREHKDLVLKGWYKCVPNTSTKSFTITGDID